MKKQQVLDLAKNMVRGHVSLIIRNIEQRKQVEREIIMHEGMISKKLAQFFESHADYEPFRNLLSLQASKEVTGYEKLPTKTLLEQISLQIAGSINKFYDVVEDYPAGFINGGFESYFISHEEWSTHFESLERDFIKKKFAEISKVFEEKFDIIFLLVSFNCKKVDEDDFIKIFVKIFS